MQEFSKSKWAIEWSILHYDKSIYIKLILISYWKGLCNEQFDVKGMNYLELVGMRSGQGCMHNLFVVGWRRRHCIVHEFNISSSKRIIDIWISWTSALDIFYLELNKSKICIMHFNTTWEEVLGDACA